MMDRVEIGEMQLGLMPGRVTIDAIVNIKKYEKSIDRLATQRWHKGLYLSVYPCPWLDVSRSGVSYFIGSVIDEAPSRAALCLVS